MAVIRWPLYTKMRVYRVTLVVSDLGWDDLDFECYVLCSMKFQVNPTQVRDHQCHPVVFSTLNLTEIAFAPRHDLADRID